MASFCVCVTGVSVCMTLGNIVVLDCVERKRGGTVREVCVNVLRDSFYTQL